jgi:hypothetical protein
MSNEIIKKFLTEGDQHIKEINKIFPLKTKEEFYTVLKWWKLISSAKTIRNLGEKRSDNTPWIFVKLGASMYYLNADTTKEGVAEFLKNKTNDWAIIVNNRGKLNKVVNTSDKSDIPGFYFYRVI